MLFLGSSNLWADEVTFDWSSITTTTTAKAAHSYTQAPITLTFDKGTNSYGNVPSENKEGSIRMYVNTSLNIKAEDGIVITKVVFTPTGSSYNATKLQYNGTALTSDEWTLETPAQSIDLTASANARFKKIVVTYQSNGSGSTKQAASLAFSATTATGNLGEAFTAPTLTNPNNLTVTYSSSATDVATVDASTGAVTLVAEGTTIITAESAETDAFYAGKATYTLTVVDPSIVTLLDEPFTTGTGSFTTEETVPSDTTFAVWQQSSSYGWKATAYVNKKRYETSARLISPEIALSGSDVTLTFEHVSRFFDTVDEEATLWVRESGGEWQQLTIPTWSTGSDWTYASSGNIDLSAYTNKTVQISFLYTSTSESAGTWEIKNLKITSKGGTTPAVTYTDETIESLNGKTGTSINNINLKLNNAVVVYVDANQGAYVREGNYAVQFYKTGLSLTAGQTLTGDIKFDYSPYYTLPEVKDITDVTTLDGVTTGTATVEPVATDLTDLKALNHKADLVKVTGVKLGSVTGTNSKGNSYTNYYAIVGTDSVQVYDRFGLNVIPTDFDDTKTYDVTGIIGSIYRGAPEIFPTEITASSTGISRLTTDEEADSVNAPVYNVAGQKVGRSYKGIVIRNGKKYIQR